MKMIMAIVNRQDSKTLIKEMMKKGFSVTKLSSEGGFLRAASVTLICVTHKERLDEALNVMKNICKSRKYDLSKAADGRSVFGSDVYNADGNPRLQSGGSAEMSRSSPHEVVVGGASVFILNVEERCKF